MPKISDEEFRQRRGNILEAARRAFARTGIHISVDEVCEAAGVSKGAFYGYFKSKDALFEALAEDHGRIIEDGRAIDDLHSLIRMIEDRASISAPEFAQLELETWTYAIRHPGLRAIFTRNTELLSDTFQTTLAKLSDSTELQPHRAAAVLQLAVQGAFLTIALKGSSASEEARTALADLLGLLGVRE